MAVFATNCNVMGNPTKVIILTKHYCMLQCFVCLTACHLCHLCSLLWWFINPLTPNDTCVITFDVVNDE